MEHKMNSPWNIAAKFQVDMSFSVEEIAGMLKEYEADYRTGMNIEEILTKRYNFRKYTQGICLLNYNYNLGKEKCFPSGRI